MRIAYVAAGAAGMYCGTCIHDNALASALIASGEDVVLVPTYTPIRTDEEDVSLDRVFFGGLNVYLQQKLALFRHTPRILNRLLDRPGVLNALSRMSGSTRAEDLGALTVSMLQGDEGPLRKEMEKLVGFLRTFEPDVIQLTNSMFGGFARGLRDAVAAPVVVAFSGEDIFLEGLTEPYRSKAYDLLQARGREPDAHVAPCRYYADHMAGLVNIDAARVDVVPLGIHTAGYGPKKKDNKDGTFRVGYLARICPEKGLHNLVEAVALLQKRNERPLALHVAGWLGKRDAEYFASVETEVEAAGLSTTFAFDVDRDEKISFLRGLDVLSVPTSYREPKGLFALEAMACGVPVVLPNHGAFPEMLSDTGGGLLCESESPAHVADAIQVLIDDEDQRLRLGWVGHDAVHRHRTDVRMAEQTMAVYRRLAG